MQRVTVSLDELTAAAFDALARDQGHGSRSEAVRDLIRRAVDERRLQQTGTGLCVANLSYVYDHHTRSLATRLVELEHDHHDIVISTTHVHLDRESCLESTLLKGPVDAVRALTDAVQAERGVRFAAVNLISAPAPEGHVHLVHAHG